MVTESLAFSAADNFMDYWLLNLSLPKCGGWCMACVEGLLGWRSECLARPKKEENNSWFHSQIVYCL